MNDISLPDETGFTENEIRFIIQNRNEDVNQLILKSGNNPGVNTKKMAAQILARQKAIKKLPEWSANEKLIFPPVLSVEQCSSEATARYKASLVSGKQLTDITGGMGVDCFYMSQNFEQTDYFEQQEEVTKTAAYNFNQLGRSDVTFHSENSLEFLSQHPLQSDWIYADPARRGSNQEKVVLLSDCTPDVVNNLPLLFANASNILIKTSPLLDIDLAVSQLRYVREVHSVGYEQECKELLFVLNQEKLNQPALLKSVVLDSSGKPAYQIHFTRKDENESPHSFSQPLRFLYEPHAAVLKSGAFKILCKLFNVNKLAASSHLYTSENSVDDFPGRIFEIIAVCKPDAKEIYKFLDQDKANLTLRNFPGKIQDLRKKWRLKEGGDFYLFATTLEDSKKVVIVTKKVKI